VIYYDGQPQDGADIIDRYNNLKKPRIDSDDKLNARWFSSRVRKQPLGRRRVTGKLQYRGKGSILLIHRSPPTNLGDDLAVYLEFLLETPRGVPVTPT
jgi:hypothetical protein